MLNVECRMPKEDRRVTLPRDLMLPLQHSAFSIRHSQLSRTRSRGVSAPRRGCAPGLTLTIWLVKLNNQLVMKRAPARPDSRDRLLAAAAAEFAARGFDGARVDRIARAARANKATIYHHF